MPHQMPVTTSRNFAQKRRVFHHGSATGKAASASPGNVSSFGSWQCELVTETALGFGSVGTEVGPNKKLIQRALPVRGGAELSSDSSRRGLDMARLAKSTTQYPAPACLPCYLTTNLRHRIGMPKRSPYYLARC